MAAITGPAALTYTRIGAGGARVVYRAGLVAAHPVRGLVYVYDHDGVQPYVDYQTQQRCPVPLDLAAVAACMLGGVTTIYVQDRRRRELRRVETSAIDGCPIRVVGNRARYMIPDRLWDVRENVRTLIKGGETLYVQDDKAILLSAPAWRDLPVIDLSPPVLRASATETEQRS